MAFQKRTRPGAGNDKKKRTSRTGGLKSKKRKICRFCENHITRINYKDERMLSRFTNERGKIIPRRISGNCARHQRRLTTAIKRARVLAILAFESESYR